ncbi:hypothetical protein [Streptomyces sp. NPDC090022]|uniref:hypothetical protein n=1 Tax=Streptomyces sp. NPDC090022 TaxID=3365920 RepID=UPI0038194B08
MDKHPPERSAPSLAALAHPRPADHLTRTAERGAFALAECSCGWRGPARRSRDLARRDADGHTA